MLLCRFFFAGAGNPIVLVEYHFAVDLVVRMRIPMRLHDDVTLNNTT